MEIDAPIAMILALGATVSCWNLQLRKICEAGEPLFGTNHILIHTDTFLGCASACDFNPYCYYLSYNDTNCVMYGDWSPCGTGVGPTRDVYKVDPACETGWNRFGRSCYLVDQNVQNAVMALWACVPYTAYPVAISNAAEGMFLAQLLRSLNESHTTAWLGGTYNLGPFETWHGSNESVVYQNWEDGEPDNLDSDVCVAMNLNSAKWTTEDCGLPMISICEKTP